MEDLGLYAEQFKMLGDKSRLTIVALLRERELCVCEIVELVGLSQPNASQHLRKLKAAGLVEESRRGQWIYYSLNVGDKPHLAAALEPIPSMKGKIGTLRANCCN